MIVVHVDCGTGMCTEMSKPATADTYKLKSELWSLKSKQITELLNNLSTLGNGS